jgi:hypothetical protein
MKDWSKLKKAAVISAVGVFGIAGLSSMNSPQKSRTHTNTSANTYTASCVNSSTI